MSDISNELWDLLNTLCERRLTPAQAARLEELVLSSPEARWQYLTYLNMHGTLYWDAAEGLAVTRLPAKTQTMGEGPILVPEPQAASVRSHRNRIGLWATIAGAAALVLVSVVWWQPADHSQDILTKTDPAVGTPAPDHTTATGHPAPRHPIQLPPHEAIVSRNSDNPAAVAPDVKNDVPIRSTIELPLDPQLPASVQRPVALINHGLRERWAAAGIAPSERADEAAWLRRVYLDLAGHIPTVEEARRFLADRKADKRQRLVDSLLDDSAYVRQMTTRWTNLLVGRLSGPQVNRPALEKFLRTSFAGNRGWDEIVAELVAAEGRSDQNGAANFLIAHLNNQAVPATAITARLFLGEQVQCTQCHNHPSGLAKQTDFWEFNSFFLQTESVTLVERDPTTGKVKSQVQELVSQPEGGPTYYETAAGVMKAVYPRYHGQDVSSEPNVNRRKELARHMLEDDGAQIAASFVNRSWEHFFGYGFTRPVDDMGPHNPPSHPELLAELSQAFRESGYDIKQLSRWICLSEPYQLSSRFNGTNEIDDPDRGETPLFSRVYPQPMSVEQLYDSFLVATKAHQHGVADWTAAEGQRQAWLAQFIVSFQTEENDEANTFDGTVTQALTLMNGPLIEKALEPSSGTVLSEVLREPGSETEKIERLCLAALSRKPNSRELTSMRKMAKSGVEGFQDLFWALLNSNEFAVVY